MAACCCKFLYKFRENGSLLFKFADTIVKNDKYMRQFLSLHNNFVLCFYYLLYLLNSLINVIETLVFFIEIFITVFEELFGFSNAFIKNVGWWNNKNVKTLKSIKDLVFRIFKYIKHRHTFPRAWIPNLHKWQRKFENRFELLRV